MNRIVEAAEIGLAVVRRLCTHIFEVQNIKKKLCFGDSIVGSARENTEEEGEGERKKY